MRDDDTPVVLLYTNTEGELTQWDYRGILKGFPKGMQLFECPNFFQLQGAWILIGSPFDPVHYYAGSFDEERLQYTPMKQGLINHSSEFYASNTLVAPGHKVYLFAWIRAFPKGLGWNGCLALPRAISLSDEGSLLQNPVPELENLRGAHHDFRACTMTPRSLCFASNILGNSELIVRAELSLDSKLEISAILGETRLPLISLEAGLFHVQSTPVPCADLPSDPRRQVDIRLFLDRSVLEVFIDGGRVCVSHMVENLNRMDSIEMSWNESVTLQSFDAWEMRPLTYSLHPSL